MLFAAALALCVMTITLNIRLGIATTLLVLVPFTILFVLAKFDIPRGAYTQTSMPWVVIWGGYAALWAIGATISFAKSHVYYDDGTWHRLAAISLPVAFASLWSAIYSWRGMRAKSRANAT